MKNILYISNKTKQLAMLHKIREHFLQKGDGEITVSVRPLQDSSVWNEDWRNAFLKADAIVLSHMGTGLDTPFMRQMAKWLYEHHPSYALLVDEADKRGLSKSFSDDELLKIEQYMANSGLLNYVRLSEYLARHRGLDIEVAEPEVLPWQGIMGERGEYYKDYDAYKKAYPQEYPHKVGLFFYREEWVTGELQYQMEVFRSLREKEVEPIVFFGQYGGKPELGEPSFDESVQALFGDSVPMDVLINTAKFSLTTLDAITQERLNALDIPILEGYAMYLSEEQWQESVQGLTAMEVSMSVSMPEMDGALHGGVVSAMTANEKGDYVYLPVAERIDAICRKAKKWATLRHKKNGDKKVAIIFHNYPPGNGTIGSACGLDSPESVRSLLERMEKEGYTVDHIPTDGDALIQEIISHATNDQDFISDRMIAEGQGKVKEKEYQKFFDGISEEKRKQFREMWGKEPGEFFHFEDFLLLPGYWNGNIWITMQPARGFGEDPSKTIHDPHCPPPHQYMAFYYWLREIAAVDALIHVGTHGTLEWLPGKGTGLSPDCFPEMAIDEMPNIYPYWTSIVGEGIQAKRRGAAALIGHLTPPMDHSGLYDGYEELETLIEEYYDFVEDVEKRETTYALITEKIVECHFDEEIKEFGEDREAIITHLHGLLMDMKHMQMRCGLHIFGKVPKKDAFRNFLSALVRVDNQGCPSLPETMAAYYGLSFTELTKAVQEKAVENWRNSQIIDWIWEAIEEILLYVQEHNYPDDASWQSVYDNTRLHRILAHRAVDKEVFLRDMTELFRRIREEYVVNINKTVNEEENTLRALSGAYVEPGLGGAPTGGRAEVLPTGRNFYGVDERTLPTKVAYEHGRILADQIIEQFILEEGRYPDQIGMVLWAGANTRSHGQCAGQFFSFLGVRPIWKAGSGRIGGLEVIPLEELGRPRIDITARISGLIRDMMPSLIKWLDKAVLLVSELDESPEDNYIKKHIGEDISWLMEDGQSYEEAFIKARWRIFGDPPGAYGAGIGNRLQNKDWDTIDDLANTYLEWGSYAYSTDKKVQHDSRLFKKRLETMEITIKNEDNHEVSMLSSDDYNAYHGGMIAAVRAYSGKAPKSYVGDSSNKNNIEIRSLQSEIKRLFRGEAVNPKFIKGMMEHGYKGAADMAEYVAHSYQWDATAAVMEDWMYEEYLERYLRDEAVREWMKKVNPWAVQRILETMLEAQKRGLWKADEAIQEEVLSMYMSMEGQLEELTDEIQ